MTVNETHRKACFSSLRKILVSIEGGSALTIRPINLLIAWKTHERMTAGELTGREARPRRVQRGRKGKSVVSRECHVPASDGAGQPRRWVGSAEGCLRADRGVLAA